MAAAAYNRGMFHAGLGSILV